jgi:dTDP-4-amino-4,6-dideoxygalactose transaminase
MRVKSSITELAVFGGGALFERPRSTSNLVRPDVDRFLSYSRLFFNARRYSNDGPVVRLLEERLARFHETRFCIAFCSGFWGLVLAMKCLALEGRREVVMPSLTYRRMADIASWAGLIPRFCEVDAQALAICAATAEPCINSDTALLLGIHPLVNCCDAAGLERLAATHGLPLLFDSVESVFEAPGGRRIGTFGAAECFSLHASKLINGFEGGYLTTNDADLAARLAVMRGFGFLGQDNAVELGSNAKLNEIHAAMALAGLDDLDGQVLRNRRRYEAYRERLASCAGIRLLQYNERERCSFKNIVVELTPDWPLSRADTLAILNQEGVLARAYYSPALHQREADYATKSGPLPLTERLAEQFMLLPCGHFVDRDDIDQIVALLAFLRAQATSIRKRWAR